MSPWSCGQVKDPEAGGYPGFSRWPHGTAGSSSKRRHTTGEQSVSAEGGQPLEARKARAGASPEPPEDPAPSTP